MSEMQTYTSTEGWSWRRLHSHKSSTSDFWVGLDLKGNHWLTKLRGSIKAHREIIFSRLGQAMNWSCQSSIYICLDGKSAKVLGRTNKEWHAAHWLINEHSHDICCTNCLLTEIREHSDKSINILLDLYKCHLATYIFGGHEPPECIFDTNHKLVIIDSEFMFCTKPSPIDDIRRDYIYKNELIKCNLSLLLSICKEIASITTHDINYAILIPDNFSRSNYTCTIKNLNLGLDYARYLIKTC